MPDWQGRPDLLRLTVAALVVCKLRLREFTLRTTLRSHGGTYYMYDEDAWVPFGGLISDITLARVKRWMGAFEGLFCVLPGDTQRNDIAVLMGIQTLRCASHLVDDNEWIQELVVDAHLQDAVNAASWTAEIATSLSKCVPKLQSDLLGKTFMSYFIEWCQETREASCASGSSMIPCTKSALCNPAR